MNSDDIFPTRSGFKEGKKDGPAKSTKDNDKQSILRKGALRNKRALSIEERIDVHTHKVVPATFITEAKSHNKILEVDSNCSIFTNLQQTFATFSPLLCGAYNDTAINYIRDDIVTSNFTSHPSRLHTPSQHINVTSLINIPLHSADSEIISASSDAKIISKKPSVNVSATTSIESRSDDDGQMPGENDDNDDDRVSREENDKDTSLLGQSLHRTSSQFGTHQKIDGVVQFSIEKGNGKQKENILINMDSAHFLGWDGLRSHYLIEEIPSTNENHMTTHSNARLSADSRCIKSSSKGRSQTSQAASYDEKQHERNYIETFKLKPIHPHIHPLHYPNLERWPEMKCSASQLPVVVHIFKQQQHHVAEVSHTESDSSCSSSIASSSYYSRESSVGDASQSFFSLLTKLAFYEKTKRKHKPRKQIANNGKMNEILDPRKLPMGEDEREIILGFLGSTSHSGSRSIRGDKTMSVNGGGKEVATFAEENSHPTRNFVFENKNGKLYLKAEDETAKRKFLPSSSATTAMLKKQIIGEQRTTKQQQQGSNLKPGWRASATKDVPRIANASQQVISLSNSKNPHSESQNTVVKQQPLLALSYNVGQKTFSSGHHNIQESMSSQAPSYYFNIFGITAVTENKSSCNSKDKGKYEGADDAELMNPCLKKCAPSFHSLLIKQKNTTHERGCLFEGWVAFLVGGPFDPVNRHWRNGQRNTFRYVVIHGGSHSLFAYDSVDALAASKSIDLSRGRVVEPVLVSKQFGYAVLVKSESTGKALCTMLPLHLSDSFFTDNGYWQLVEQNLFAKKWKSAYPRPKAKWGDSDCLECFASPNQNAAFLHLFFTINNVIIKSSKYDRGCH